MLVIRLQRTGRENLPAYRLVVAQKSKPVKGKFLDILGHYLPSRTPSVFDHNDEKINEWIKKGAIPSDTVARLLKKEGLKDMDKFIKKYTKQRAKKAPPEAPAQAATEPAPAPEAEAAA